MSTRTIMNVYTFRDILALHVHIGFGGRQNVHTGHQSDHDKEQKKGRGFHGFCLTRRKN
jgi:hypothetical protein